MANLKVYCHGITGLATNMASKLILNRNKSRCILRVYRLNRVFFRRTETGYKITVNQCPGVAFHLTGFRVFPKSYKNPVGDPVPPAQYHRLVRLVPADIFPWNIFVNRENSPTNILHQ